ncbi:zinc-dependent metalloprotease [Calothrix sp. 336/3]|uniref:zinc-dependent metalloprotease n=1 Tax=Calothrix sp. 336/3 TaxID=1337936 RepID=UPI0004E35027|nr:zinc-dependent metalloprotease [Calothrix sp. 336/3]AKG21746.1 peptidase M43 [Calothrix sp. 336/3]
MKRLVCCLVAAHGCLFGLVTLTAKTAKGEVKNQQEQSNVSRTPSFLSSVWVINPSRQVERQSFLWVGKDAKKSGQQPLLIVGKTPETVKEKVDTITPGAKKDDLQPFDKVVKDTQKLEGLFTLYRDPQKNKIYLEIQAEQLNKNFLATATLESGTGEKGIYSGMPLQDFLFYFHRVQDNLQFTVKNVNFRTKEDDPQGRSLARSFSDSVLYSIPIKSIHPQRKTLLIDLDDLLLQDVGGLSAGLGITGRLEQSYFGSAKTFPQNIEVQSILNYSSSSKTNPQESITLADNRGFTLKVHYSLSQLPESNYRPRLADDRLGYFLTAYQDLSNSDRAEPFVRYINRWHLEKQNPTAAISPPVKPIVFWIDNAVPYEYRDAIREGVLMWNQAFAKAGFQDAIQVKQMPDNANWDPADIRYNTIRWINTVDGYFAMGPSRVNPLTGEILDADILVDASFVRLLRSDYEQVVQPSENRTTLSAMMQNRLLCAQGLGTNPGNTGLTGKLNRMAGEYDLCYGMEAANQFAFGALALSLLQETPASTVQVKDYIHQYLRLIIAHEVGHTLGLRHNFRGSNLLPPQEMNNKAVSQQKGLSSSVMDYIPPNIAPQGSKQGDYFPQQVGVYDQWAIQYGYTPINATSPMAEKAVLNKIAAMSAQKPELSYSTDEDIYDLDPTADAWDNSNNVLEYSRWQLDNARVMWDRLNKRYPAQGESYSDVRERFGTVLGNYVQNVYYISKYIGGQSFYRIHGGNSQGKLPFAPIPVSQQRQALKNLHQYVFAEDAWNFSPELLNKLAPSRWRHWGSNPKVGRLDYPIHDLVIFMQGAVLADLLSGDRLSRLKDIELKSSPEQALSIPELFTTLQDSIWTEVVKPKNNNIKIPSLRRGLQRRYLDILADMVLRKQKVPEDARTLAWYKLKQLNQELEKVKSEDEYTKAHLMETRDRIQKVLDAPLQGN